MANISRHGDGWRAQVARLGVRKSAVWPTKREAVDWAAKVEAEILAASKLPPADTHTFGDLCEKYEPVIQAKAGAKFETLRLAALCAYFGEKTKLSAITQPTIAAWRDHRLETVSAATVLREVTILKHAFSKARKEWRWIEHDPFDGVQMPAEPEHRHQVWRWQEIKRVVRRLGYVSGKKPETKMQQVALAFMLTLRTSMRASEVLRIGPKTFDPVTRVIVVKAKNILRSEIPCTKQAARLCKLADFTITAPSLDALFRKARDQVLLSHLHYHDGRATALTLMARRVDILTLSRISQHRNLKMLQRYYRESSAQIAARL